MKKTIGLITANYTVDEIDEQMQERALAAMPFGGRYRLIDFPLSNMKNSGISSVGIIMPFNNRSLIDHVGTGKAWGFGRKTNSLFMLPGSVYGKRNNTDRFLLRDIIMNFRFIDYDNADYVVLSAVNTVCNMDLRPMIAQHEKSGCDMTVAYAKKKGAEIPLDVLVINRSFLIDIASWFSNLDFMGIRAIIADHLGDADIGRYEFDGEVIVINTMADYLAGNLALLNAETHQAIFHPDRQVYTNVQDRAPTFYTSTAKVKNSIIAAGCIIEGEVENSVIFRSSNVHKGAVVKNSVLMQHCNVGSGTYLNNFICDKRVHVMENAHVEGTPQAPFFAQKGQ
ncbi:MAG: hypothetical protein J6S60_02485, partial [Oscillospiraceae bacterium]|nr:hypothetical protein [Oscillospiraceae bacterium]